MIILKTFIDLAVESYYDCCIWDNNKEEIVFQGMIDDIPDELLECEVGGWEMLDDGRIEFNIE